MAAEQALLARYDVQPQEVIPLITALEAHADYHEETKWGLLIPGEDEPRSTTYVEATAEGWRALGGITLKRVVQRRRTGNRVDPVQLTDWWRAVQRADEEHVHASPEDGGIRVNKYANRVDVETPTRLGQSEHIRRRRVVETALKAAGVEYDVECLTIHSDRACARLEPSTEVPA